MARPTPSRLGSRPCRCSHSALSTPAPRAGAAFQLRASPRLLPLLLPPGVQRGAAVIHFFKRANDVIHVRPRSEKEILSKPKALFTANQVTVGTTCFAEIQPGGTLRQE